MKAKYIISSIIGAVALLMVMTFSSCSDDLNISNIDPQSDAEFDQEATFVKMYALLGLTGQTGSSGNGDLSSMDEGESGFYRTIFNCQELCSDECLWAWQSDTDIPQLTFISWNSSSQRTEWVYYRLGVNITHMNFFLDQIEGKTDATSNLQRAEVRFLRALHYYYFLDLFGKAPFKEHFDNDLPVEYDGQAIYDYIQSELADIEDEMSDYNCNSTSFGRADKVANWLLRARLYLNAEIYTGTADWANAVTYAGKVISSDYQLNTTETNGYSAYQQLFMADNDENTNAMQEIIFPIRQDGAKTQSYSGSTYLVCSIYTSGMPRIGTTNPWTCIFSRGAMTEKFFPDTDEVPLPGECVTGLSDDDIDALDETYGTRTVDLIAACGDERCLLYSGVGGSSIRTIVAEDITGFYGGLSFCKWANIRTDGESTNHDEFPDVDIPLFRVAEAYLTRAEANYRLGNTSSALSDINVLRSRANAETWTELTEQDIIDEWCREFYLEGRRRSDLIRFGMFTTNKYVWDWKGGTQAGTAVDSHFNVYPIPESDLNNNPNMTQNDGY